jgi:hypothetical protein
MTISNSIKENIKSLLLKFNWRFSRATDYELLSNFFNTINPISTNFGLIRMGGETDGGYLIPDDLEGIESCFSPGVSETANFEFELSKNGIHCFMADYSVDGPPLNSELFHFEKKYLGLTENSVYTTLESWVTRNATNLNDSILQMDIEGSEYGVILDTSPDILRKFRIIVVEFHRLDDLCDKFGYEIINHSFRKLLKDFDIVHIHPNNCLKPVAYGKFEIPPVLEVTFLRKDRILDSKPTLIFPHQLDRQNVPNYDDYPLPSCWFGQS